MHRPATGNGDVTGPTYSIAMLRSNMRLARFNMSTILSADARRCVTTVFLSHWKQ
jgi:hypothetical protein